MDHKESLLGMLVAKLAGHSVPDYFVMGIFVMVASLLACWLVTRRLSVDRPRAGQQILEILVETLGKFVDDIIGHGGRKYLPVVGTFGFLILLWNLIGLVPGFTPPTDKIIVTLSLGLCSFVTYNAIGFWNMGFRYLKHFLGPMLPLAVLFLPIEMVSHIARPVSLGIRLFGNIFGDHLVGSVFLGLIPLVVPVPFILLAIFVSFMQAFVFTLLSMIYIAGAVEHH
jgi:F-type H+-transporting ATPase subunit a